MSGKLRKKKVMIGCPEDAERYIESVKLGIKEFNEEYRNTYNVVLETSHYKSDTYSTQDNPQKAINRQLCDSCDLLIAVFYMSAGTAEATNKTGTFEEIDYFKNKDKNAFVFCFTGNANVDLGNKQKREQLNNLLNVLKENQKGIFYADYQNENELAQKVKRNLKNYFELNKSKRKSPRNKNNKAVKTLNRNELQLHMECCMRQNDSWNWMAQQFSFYSKSMKLIDGIREDGSVQYYVGKKERYRTTPVASVLEALHLGALIPESVRRKMQDWVYNSKEDPCDEPNKLKTEETGHKPDDCDQFGWSWNEGVSVWATSKALNTLIMTDYYKREDICNNQEIHEVTCKALNWLADQAYDNGGWGFQKAENLVDCAASVTMTALTLTTITRFLLATEERNGIALDDNLENKLSEAKKKGIDYLLNTKKEIDDKVYWEYNGSPSLTGTVWVLDFINVGKRRETGDLFPLKDKILNFCMENIPSTDDELERYQEEVYFTGGKTKYKKIEKNNKFYSYMPYHIAVLLQAGADPDDKHIMTCIMGLISGKEDYWIGTDRSAGAHQRASCFVIAMALSVIAVWMKRKIKKSL